MIPSAFLVCWPMTTLRTAQILSNIHFLMSNTKRFRKAEDVTIQEEGILGSMLTEDLCRF